MQKDLFEKKQLVSDKLSPTFPEYHEHIKRANFQAYIWNNATVPMLNLPPPIGNGWSQDEEGNICPTKMLNPPAPEGFVEITICKCKTTCGTNRCSCESNGLQCSGACYCETHENNVEDIQIVRRVKPQVKRITLMINLDTTSQRVVYKIDSTNYEHTCFSFF